MRTRRRQPRIAALGLVAVVAAWLWLAPASVGGQATYLIISGASMEPGMRRGDLAILRAEAAYAVGDVVTYRHPEIGPVIHRIIGRDGERFVFQGDNNRFVDPYQPTRDELIGRLWLRLPRAGTLLQTLRQPPIFAALATTLLGAAVMAPASPSLRPRRRRGAAPTRAAQGQHLGRLNAALTACLAVGMLALALAALSFTRPTTRLEGSELTYLQRGQFDYHAPAPAGLYDGGAARAGDPLFLQITSSVPVSFTYSLSSPAPTELSGTARLSAVLSDGAGWRRSFPLGAETPFAARSVTVAGVLDLAVLREAIGAYERLSGLTRGQYMLDLRAEVRAAGRLGGAPLATSFGPTLRFTLDTKALWPATGPEGAALDHEEPGSVAVQREAPSTLALGPLRLEVGAARRLALAGLEIALIGGLLASWRLGRAMRADAGAAARLRYGHLFVRAAAGGAWAAEAARLASLDELARLAERLGQPILVLEGDEGAGYYVRDGTLAYGFQPRADVPPDAETV